MIDIEDPPEEYVDDLMKLRYSRIPVCQGETDNIIGILNIKDYLIQAWEKGFEAVDIASILRTPYFVPETKNIDALLFELQKMKQQDRDSDRRVRRLQRHCHHGGYHRAGCRRH